MQIKGHTFSSYVFIYYCLFDYVRIPNLYNTKNNFTTKLNSFHFCNSVTFTKLSLAIVSYQLFIKISTRQ